MTLNDYQKAADRTSGDLCPWDKIRNGCYGLNGEAGECIDILKKVEFQGHTFDPNRLIDELGDVLWYVAQTAIGIYIGDGLAVECTPKWKNCVQITAVANIGSKSGYNARTWKKHGHIPYVEYSGKTEAPAPEKDTPSAPASGKEVKATGFDKSLAGTYTVTAASGLNVRNAAGTNNKVLVAIPKGTKVQNYGYYTLVGGVKWLYVKFTYNGVTYIGFASASYLKK